MEPIRITTVQKKTLMIDENGIRQKISIDRVTRAPDTTNKSRHQLQEMPQIKILLGKESSQNDTPEGQDFVVDEIVQLIGTGPETKYVLRWYGYSPPKETVEAPEHIPQATKSKVLKLES